VREKGLTQVSDTDAIGAAVERAIAENPEQVRKYLSGNEKVLGFFVGETMKLTKGKANPGMVNEMLRRALAARKG
jgi:aspartyl-tRNA(Asn)/glutamyl-tRNA(Gln) amidotransferase subunit B